MSAKQVYGTNSYDIIRARAPLQLGLAGGGADVSPYCDRYGGLVLNATIDKYAYTIIEPAEYGAASFATVGVSSDANAPNANITGASSGATVRFFAADRQETWEGTALPELILDRKLDLHKGIYNRIVREFNGGEPLPLTRSTHSDAPPGSGLGTSSNPGGLYGQGLRRVAEPAPGRV